MKKWMYNALIILFALLFFGSGIALAFYYMESDREAARYEDLAQLRPTSPLPTTPEQPDQPAVTGPEMVTVTDPKTGAQLEIFKEFEALYGMNSDLIGWLTIPGVAVDYPVVHTPDDPQYYLRRNFDKKRQTRGCLFLDGAADPWKPSDNLTIYGHRMQDGTMFGQLEKYKKKAFWEQNRYIYFDTLTSKGTYEIVAVFKTSGSTGFDYHLFVDGNEPEFFDFMAKVKDLAMYDTGVEAAYGDQLLTLSTCDYTLSNGRFVVVAKRIEN